MTLNDLRYIVAVDTFGSFKQAADTCFVTQPTLSGQVKKLERELGVSLFERTTRSVMTTDIGKQIVAQAKRVLAQSEAITDLVSHHHDPFSGSIKLGAFPTLGPYLYPQIIPSITQTMPKLQLELVEEKTAVLEAMLINGELDAAFLATDVTQSSLAVSVLFDDIFKVALSERHPLAEKSLLSLQDVSAYSVLLLDDGHCLRDQAMSLCAIQQIPVDHNYRASSLETIREMVRANSGITLMPDIATRSDDPGIVYRSLEPPCAKSSHSTRMAKNQCETTRHRCDFIDRNEHKSRSSRHWIKTPIN